MNSKIFYSYIVSLVFTLGAYDCYAANGAQNSSSAESKQFNSKKDDKDTQSKTRQGLSSSSSVQVSTQNSSTSKVMSATAHSDKGASQDKKEIATNKTKESQQHSGKPNKAKNKYTHKTEQKCPTNFLPPKRCKGRDAVREHYAHFMDKDKCLDKPAKPKRLINSIRFCPYIGAEYQYQHIKANSSWHDAGFMPANLDIVNGFLGLRYHRNFAIEFGMYHTVRRSQEQATVTSFEGQAASGQTIVMGQLENKGWSVDWTAHCFWDPKFNVFALIGMANYQPKLVLITSEGTDLGDALRLVKGRNRNVFRLGLGMEYLECWWGARARVIWDNTQNMNLDVESARAIFPAIGPNAFSQTIVVTLGLFYRF